MPSVIMMSIIMARVIMLSVITLSVIMLNVAAPNFKSLVEGEGLGDGEAPAGLEGPADHRP
jgi:hypothetical protein